MKISPHNTTNIANIASTPLFSALTEPRMYLLLLLVFGILLQIMVCFMLFRGQESLKKAANKSFSFRMNKAIVYRLLLLFGMLCVNMVAIFESDYILLVGQCLFFILVYPKGE